MPKNRDHKKRDAKDAGLSTLSASEPSSATQPPPPARLVDINEHIMCTLCGGYLREALTITDCLHSFCKSCLLLHLKDIQGTQTCPRAGCSTAVMCKQRPDHSFKVKGMLADSTMQSLTDKSVPDVVEEDKRLEEQFYAQHEAAAAKAAAATAGAAAGAADKKGVTVGSGKKQIQLEAPQSMTEQAPFF